MMTDPVSDMLTRLRNAAMARGRKVSMPMSRMKFAIAKILEREGYIEDVGVTEEGSRSILNVTLKYDPATGDCVLSSLKRVSKPGCRVYVRSGEIPSVRSGLGLSILSTPSGLMTGSDARKRRLGGELICEVF